MIPYGKQNISSADIEAVQQVLSSDFLTQGPCVPVFEQQVAQKVGAQYGVAANSATSALHLACLALGLGSGDWLWTSPISFVASANCGLYCGAKVDFVDIEPSTFNMCTEALEKKLNDAEANGLLPKVIIPVHMCGQPCDMQKIKRLSERFGFKIIEDASHAIGARYRNDYVGNCQYSDITVFSFHPVKIITTAEGGMATTNCDKLAARMKLLRSHGVTRDEKSMTQSPHGPWYYQQIALGFNFRMTEIQAALGISQLKRLDCFVDKRQRLAKKYESLLQGVPVSLPSQSTDRYSSYHLYVVRLKLDEVKKSRRDVFDSLRAQGVGVNVHYIPIHLQPYFQNLGFYDGQFPNAEQYYKEAISLPMFPDLGEEGQKWVADCLRDLISREG